MIGYHEEHRSALEVLHQRVGEPNETVIQDFTPDLHTNLIQEIQVLGEIEIGQTLRLNVGDEENEHWILAMPVYAVGDDFTPLVEYLIHERNGGERRPMARSRVGEIAQKSKAMREIRNTALAYAILDGAQNEEGSTFHENQRVEVLHEVGGRQLIRMTGAIVSGATLLSKVANEMSDESVMSTPDTLLVEPTSRTPAGLFSSQRADEARVILSSLGILCATLALLLPLFQAVRETRTRERADYKEVQAVHGFPAVSFFEPLASQAEIAQEERGADQRKSKEPTRFRGRLRGLGSKLLGVRLKTPQ